LSVRAPGGSTAPLGLSVQEIADPSGLDVLRPDWDRLLAECPDPSVFLSYEWFRPWWKSFGRGKLALYAVRDQGDLIGLAPLARRRWPGGLPLVGLRSLTNEHSSRYDWLIHKERLDEVVAALAARLAEQDSWHLLEFTYVPDGSAAMAALEREASARGWRVRRVVHGASPSIPIQGDWSEYFARLPKSLRGHLRKAERMLREAGEPSLVAVRAAEGLPEILSRAFALEAMGWKGRRGTAIVSSEATRGFYSELAALQAEKGRLALYFLKLGETEVAFRYGLEYGGAFSSVKIGYNPQYARFSPGKVLLQKILEELFSKPNCTRYDMLGTCVPWKMEWAREVMTTERILIYRQGLLPAWAHALHFALPDLLKRSGLVRRVLSWWRARRDSDG